MKEIEVCGHYVALIPDDIEKTSKGGIVLAEEYDSSKASRVEAASTTGIVVGIGPTAWKAYDSSDPDWKPWCEIGDRVVFTKHVAKVYEDKDDLQDGKPRKIFIIVDENVLLNLGKAEKQLEEVA